MHPDTGTVSVFVVVIAVALLAVTGLVLDGGRLLAARREAQDIAANAARAGAQALDEHRLRSGRKVLDASASSRAVAEYLAQARASGTSRVTADRVTVSVRMPVRMLLPAIVGRGMQTVTATEQARAVQGVTVGDG
jgi:Flp pilus assembly protein TadG